MRSLLLALTALALVAPATAQALELGIQDAQASIEQRNQWAASTHATWERLIAYVGQPGVAQRIRESHRAGRKVILTVGGNGTASRRPSFRLALRYIRTLPRADRYTIDNEPDLDGVKACTYRKGWMKARRTLGRRLLWGDLSPHGALRFTQAARACGPLPKHLDFAVHPYQEDNPLKPTANGNSSEGCLGCLPRARRWLKTNVGVRATWWLTEFGYSAHRSIEDGLVLDGLSDPEAAVMWPRAVMQARRVHARVLVLYTASGPSWDTRPGLLAWAAIRGAA